MMRRRSAGSRGGGVAGLRDGSRWRAGDRQSDCERERRTHGVGERVCGHSLSLLLPRMSEPSRAYDDWKAPSEDGQMLIWPEPPRLLADARRTPARSNAASNVPPAGCSRCRKCAAGRGRLSGMPSIDQPLVATGHQTELSHPGVWVKNALINSIARRTRRGGVPLRGRYRCAQAPSLAMAGRVVTDHG